MNPAPVHLGQALTFGFDKDISNVEISSLYTGFVLLFAMLVINIFAILYI